MLGFVSTLLLQLQLMRQHAPGVARLAALAVLGRTAGWQPRAAGLVAVIGVVPRQLAPQDADTAWLRQTRSHRGHKYEEGPVECARVVFIGVCRWRRIDLHAAVVFRLAPRERTDVIPPNLDSTVPCM